MKEFVVHFFSRVRRYVGAPLSASRSHKASFEGETGSREGVLLIACQFRAAVHTHTLLEYLGDDPVATLLLAFDAYSEIGAVQIAAALRGSLIDCADHPSPAWLKARVAHLEEQLLAMDEGLDELIMTYAAHLASSGSSRRAELSMSDSVRL